MALTQIDGNRQIKSDTITDLQINSAAGILTSKLADSANFAMKTYVDNSVLAALQGLNVKQSVRVIALVALPAHTVDSNGVLVASGNGILTVDGVATVLNDRIGVFGEGNVQNGIYKVTVEGTAGVPFQLTRAVDADTTLEWAGGDVFFFVREGSAPHADKGFVTTNDSAIVVGTTTIVVAPFVDISSNLTESNFVSRETPAGTVNGINAIFTLANTPYAASEEVYLNGLLQEPGGEDYTISTNTITFGSAPLTGDRIRVSYRK